ncbi:discoidin domain-containing protein [Amycolatopsis rhabdoformis]|uniref:Discoidin domain-containing protein n=1 Tax=Amycolatopsis rhabdoformis TaxID=1448059 RepID=A0ABZ1HYR5_9PSEU|nr:discoidin domain-containing protein [Amycolatopsis rhabdoformis]WSE26498.1 discoidin domain-containing protein [Amycolatopsis rhabdoformis]
MAARRPARDGEGRRHRAAHRPPRPLHRRPHHGPLPPRRTGRRTSLTPKGPGDNLLLGEQATPSSTNGSFSPCGAVDGDSNGDHWSTTTGWNDGTKSAFPDTYAVALPTPTTLARTVTTTLDSTKYPAPKYGLRDFDVQAQVSGAWVTVASIRGNTAGSVTSTFPPVQASAVQIVALDSNDHAYSRLVELAAYSS